MYQQYKKTEGRWIRNFKIVIENFVFNVKVFQKKFLYCLYYLSVTMSNQIKEKQVKNRVKKLSSAAAVKNYSVNKKDKFCQDKIFNENRILELRKNLVKERKKYRLIDNRGIQVNKELNETVRRLLILGIRIDRMEKELIEIRRKNDFIRNANFGLMHERNALKRELNELEKNGIAISSFRKDILKNNVDYYGVFG